MLIKVKYLNFETSYQYAPPQQEGVINTDAIQSVVTTDARGSGPFVKIQFRDGRTMVCVGKPTDFLPVPLIPEYEP